MIKTVISDGMDKLLYVFSMRLLYAEYCIVYILLLRDRCRSCVVAEIQGGMMATGRWSNAACLDATVAAVDAYF